MYACIFSHMPATCLVHLVLLDFVTILYIFDEMCILRSSALYRFLSSLMQLYLGRQVVWTESNFWHYESGHEPSYFFLKLSFLNCGT
jgi:hypothetical protein